MTSRTASGGDPGFRCQICGQAARAWYQVREMMFGTRDVFDYAECGQCHALQLANPPADMSPYYPAAYHAAQLTPARTGLRRVLRRSRNAGTFISAGLWKRALTRAAPYPVFGAERWFPLMHASTSSRVLDVGCGSGMLVRDLAAIGFRSAEGIDPLIPAEGASGSAPVIRRISINEVDGEYDVVMFHHVLEHLSDQVGVMRAAAARLADGGWCLVRVPTVDSWAWEHYREHWVQLDAPRHLVIHSIASLGRLGELAGLRLVTTIDDSTELQFVGSESYAMDIPLAERSRPPGWAARRRLRRRARVLNAARRGDQVACFFRKE